MPQFKALRSGWRGICLVAITYVYFLIFAQFAFLKRVASVDIANEHLKVVMGAMGFGGILLSLLAPRSNAFPSPKLRLRVGFGACGAAAALCLLPMNFNASIGVAFLIGCGLGLLTVTLVTWLRLWLGSGYWLWKVGLGTGIGYWLCNLPPLFTASPEIQATVAALLCGVGICITFRNPQTPITKLSAEPESTLPFFQVLAGFTALIWLDSAAFFIIQNTPALKAGTWEGSVHLWLNGLLHFGAALAAAWWLRRRGLPSLLAAAFLTLACGCLLLLDPNRALIASAFYPIGVSLYSVALVAYPSLLTRASSDVERGRQAGWIYAVAGWFGSAMGIGMGQNLGHVPPAFVLLAGAVVFAPWLLAVLRRRRREVIATAAVLTVALCIDLGIVAIHADNPDVSSVTRGRQVYIAEGCINCHSQYVRPNTPDVLLWGPGRSIEELRHEQPPLIGNRRQGPDLAEVGSRRSALWFKAHLIDPAEISSTSFMPSYAYLFRDQRGTDLVHYLVSLQGGNVRQHRSMEESWAPSSAVVAQADSSHGRQLFGAYCAACHTDAGLARQRWHTEFRKLPPDLSATAQTQNRIAQIVKFGIPGTDMPGHEYLPDEEIASISLWLKR